MAQRQARYNGESSRIAEGETLEGLQIEKKDRVDPRPYLDNGRSELDK